jgi:hypothetical protein
LQRLELPFADLAEGLWAIDKRCAIKKLSSWAAIGQTWVAAPAAVDYEALRRAHPTALGREPQGHTGDVRQHHLGLDALAMLKFLFNFKCDP